MLRIQVQATVCKENNYNNNYGIFRAALQDRIRTFFCRIRITVGWVGLSFFITAWDEEMALMCSVIPLRGPQVTGNKPKSRQLKLINGWGDYPTIRRRKFFANNFVKPAFLHVLMRPMGWGFWPKSVENLMKLSLSRFRRHMSSECHLEDLLPVKICHL